LNLILTQKLTTAIESGFFPDKFWQATKGMPRDEVTRLMEEVERLAGAKDTRALSKYPFVRVGDPYKKQHNAA